MFRHMMHNKGAWPTARHSRRQSSGQALVETAIVLGLILFVVLGAIDLMQWQLVHYSVERAARAAAHQAALDGGASTGATNTAKIVLDGGVITNSEHAEHISVSCATNPCRRYSAITVTIKYSDDFWVPVWPDLRIRSEAKATRASEKEGGSRTTPPPAGPIRPSPKPRPGLPPTTGPAMAEPASERRCTIPGCL